MAWYQCYEAIKPYVFKVETPNGHGTGTFIAYNRDRSAFAFATAWHVIARQEEWKEPIKLTQETTGKSVYLTDKNRVIFPIQQRDSAGIMVFKHEFDLPKEPLRMMARDKYKSIGTEVGWVGYPGIAEPHLCFFSGYISAYVPNNESYFIDGVAIHGVSGGPVFCQVRDTVPELLGTVSAYRANRLTGETLPGILCAQDVSPFHELIDVIKNVDDARERKEEESEKPQKAEPLPMEKNNPPSAK